MILRQPVPIVLLRNRPIISHLFATKLNMTLHTRRLLVEMIKIPKFIKYILLFFSDQTADLLDKVLFYLPWRYSHGPVMGNDATS